MTSSPRRPLSPHLQIYKPQITSVLSILHRLTGMALAIGTILLTVHLVSAAMGEATYNTVRGFEQSWPGKIMIFGWVVSLNYHLLNGIRHLFWDAGMGFELKTAYRSGYMVLAGTAILTGLVYWFACTCNIYGGL